MSIPDLLVLLLLGGACGLVAELIVGYRPGGFLVSIVVGLMGAFLGTWMASRLGLPSIVQIQTPTANGGLIFDVVWSILGATVILLVVSLGRNARSRAS